MPLPDILPTYAQLSERDDAPRGSNWGLFGAGDQLGTINFLTPKRVAAAAKLARKGAVFSLDLPLHLPDPPLFNRGRYEHHIERFEQGMGHDDYLDNFYLQASSQWDSLAHVGHPRHGLYNGVQPEDVTGKDGSKNGIDRWVEHGIVGRGVLLDVARHLEAEGAAIDGMSSRAIKVAELESTASAQGIAIEPGDIVLVRTGWEQAYMAADQSTREAVAADLHSPGLEGSMEMAAWLWDHQIAAVASDCPALEPWPWDLSVGALHVRALCYLGMPFGELWSLEALAGDCAEDGVYAFLLTSAPLNLRGGIGSPPNAIAIK
ncbi:MAG: cyclase family protein [Chloroflexi bacterium]|nr:cyclase family protein [Chloroflexota bacterium]